MQLCSGPNEKRIFFWSVIKYSNTLCLFSKIRLNEQNVFATLSVSMGGVSLFIKELIE